MKIILHIILFLLLIQTAYSETQLFAGKLLTDADKQIDGKTFRFSYDEPSQKAFAQNPALNLIIPLGECGFNSFFKICINQANFSYRNYTTYKRYYELDVEIYKQDYSGITFNSTYPDELLQGERGDLKISFLNPTTQNIKNVQISMDLSKFAVTNVLGCEFDGTKISWKGNMNPSFYKSCSMSIVPLTEGTFQLVANAIYDLGSQNFNENNGVGTIIALPDQLKIVSSFNNAEINEDFYLNLSVSNIHSTDHADIIAVFSFPRQIYFVKDVPFDEKTASMKDGFKLNPGESKNFSFQMRSTTELTTPITTDFTYTIDGISDIVTNVTFINVSEVKPVIGLIPESNNATPGQKFVVVAKINNPSAKFDIGNVVATLSTAGNENIVQKLDLIRPKQTLVIISHTIIIPKDKKDSYDLYLALEYFINGQKKYSNAKMTIGLNNGTITQANNATSSPQLQNPSQIEDSATGTATSITKGISSVFSLIGNFGSFQKTVLITGSVITISVLVIYGVLRRAKLKQAEKIRESAEELNKSIKDNEVEDIKKMERE